MDEARQFSVPGQVGTELAALSDGDLLNGLRADCAAMSTAQGRVLAGIAELCFRDPEEAGGRAPFWLASAEVSAELSWTKRRSDDEIDLALFAMVERPAA